MTGQISDEARRKYERDARQMLAAVRDWKRMHDAAALAALVLYMPPAETFVCAPLDHPIMELVARDERARTFIAWIDERTDYQGTLEMLRACLFAERVPVKHFTEGDLQLVGTLVPLVPFRGGQA